MAITSPATGDPGLASWADAVAAAANAAPQMNNGGTNVPPTSTGVKVQSGTFAAAFSASGVATGSITWPNGAFATVPVVTWGVLITVAACIVVSWTAVSTTGLSWRAETNNGNTTSTTQTVHWIAIGT